MRLKTKKMAKRFKITEDYDAVLACCSGGKDSSVAALLAFLHVPLDKLHVVYFGSSWDFPGTMEQVEMMCEDWGVNFIAITPLVDPTEYLKDHGPPNLFSRWCTRLIKEDPMNKKVRPLFEGKRIIYVDGTRREESTQRSNIDLFETGRAARGYKKDVLHAIYDWTEKRVWSVMRAFELPIHPIYRWSNRLSCFCCPLQSRGSWLSLRRFHPELFERTLELERIAGKPWMLKHKWLRDLESEERPEGLKEPTMKSLIKVERS